MQALFHHAVGSQGNRKGRPYYKHIWPPTNKMVNTSPRDIYTTTMKFVER